jgi:putative oxidoreductase
MDWVWLAGRILFSIGFITAAIGHLRNFAHASKIASASGAPFPKLFTFVSVLLSLLGGISTAAGYHVEIGTVLLLLFLLPVTFMTHRFWKYADPREAGMHQAHFMKNIGLVGGALLILYFGAGPLSLG